MKPLCWRTKTFGRVGCKMRAPQYQEPMPVEVPDAILAPTCVGRFWDDHWSPDMPRLKER